MSYRFTGDLIIEVFDLGEHDFDDLKARIEQAAAAHKAAVTVTGRRFEESDDSQGAQQ